MRRTLSILVGLCLLGAGGYWVLLNQTANPQPGNASPQQDARGMASHTTPEAIAAAEASSAPDLAEPLGMASASSPANAVLADQGRLPERGGHALYRGELLDTEVVPTDDADVFIRTRLLRTAFHLPILRVEELLRLSGSGDELEVINQLGMIGDHVLVHLMQGSDLQAWTAFLAAHGMEVRRALRLPGWYRVVIPATSVDDLPTALARLRAYTDVTCAEPDHIVQSTQNDPDDPAWVNDLLWGLRNVGQQDGIAGNDIRASDGWLIRNSAPDVIVGVIDTGIHYTHEDLVANMWVNPGETADGSDSDGNGYIDDIHGINAITGSGDPKDDNRHGTHCAGTIGAVGNNGIGLTGVAWNVQLIALKFLSAGGSGATSDAADCIVYGVDHGASVLSNSWGGGGFNQALVDAIEYAAMGDVIFVAAAGNDSNNLDPAPQYPASYPVENIVSVASYDRTGARSFFSNYGQASVHLAAPGSNIYSTTFSQDDPIATNRYEELSGTSMATPHVSGVMALMRQQFPAENHLQIINRAMASADRTVMQAQVIAGGIRLPDALSGEPAGPFNDAFANARYLGKRSFVAFANNALATAEAGEPSHAELPARHSVWFRWQAPFANLVDVYTRSADFDTVVAVYQGDDFGNLTLLAANDNADNSADGIDSFLNFTTTNNATYYLAVDSADGGTGSFRLTIKNAPPNDDFAKAQTLSGTGGTFRPDNTGATKEPGEPRHGGLWGGSSLWYQFTAPHDGRLRVGIGDGSPTRIGIGIYQGDEVSNLEELGGVLAEQNTSDQNAYAIVRGGETYRFAVDTPDGRERWFFVNWAFTSNQIGFAEPTISVAEDVATASVVIPVSRFSGLASFGAASVDYATSAPVDGARADIDYTPVSGTLSWGSNEQGDRFITVPILDNGRIQSARELHITLTHPTGGSYLLPGATRIRILITDDDSPLANQTDFDAAIVFKETLLEPLDLDAAAWVAIERIGDSDRAESVSITAIDGSAAAGMDFAAPETTVNFASGQMIAWVEVPLLEPIIGRSFQLQLSAASHPATVLPVAQASATVRITAGNPPPWYDQMRLLSTDAAGERLSGPRSFDHIDLSETGRFVVFATDASMVRLDTNGLEDIYLRDIATGTVSLISQSIFGTAGNGESTRPTISADGRWIVYESAASDILDDDANGDIRDIILLDRVTGARRAVNRNSDGELAQVQYVNLGHPVYIDSYQGAISKDGRYVVFVSAANNLDTVHVDPWWDDGVYIHELATGLTETVSAGNEWLLNRQKSFQPSISADGQRVAYISNAVLSPADTNGQRDDVYLRNISDKTTQLLSTRPSGQAHDSYSRILNVSISGDGAAVFFSTAIPGLVADDTDTRVNLFRRDLQSNSTARMDTAPNGEAASAALASGNSYAVSHDGNVVSFITAANNLLHDDTNGAADVFTRNLTNGLLTSPVRSVNGTVLSGNDMAITMTADGAAVVFVSGKSGLVEPATGSQLELFGGPSGAAETDAIIRMAQDHYSFLRTRGPEQTLAVTVLRGGLINETVAVHYTTTDGTAQAGIDYGATSGILTFAPQQVSAVVAIPIFNPPGGDPVKRFTLHLSSSAGSMRVEAPASATIELSDIDGEIGSIRRITELNGVAGAGNSRAPSLAASGERIAFSSYANNLSETDSSSRNKAFVYDYAANDLSLRAVAGDGNPASGTVRNPVISPDGNWLVFQSVATNLTRYPFTSFHYQVFLENLATGEIILVSKNPISDTAGDGSSGNSTWSGFAADVSRPGMAISTDAAYIAFQSAASNLVDGDDNGLIDIFLWERATGNLSIVSRPAAGGSGVGGTSYHPEITPDGRFVVFISSKSNLVANDTNNGADVFRFDRASGELIRVNLSSAGNESMESLCYVADISDDGDRVVFDSTAANLVNGDANDVADIFLHTVSTGETIRVNLNSEGEQARSFYNGMRMAGHSLSPTISGDGRYVVFYSEAYDLVADIAFEQLVLGDTTYTLTDPNLFVSDTLTGATTNLIAVSADIYGRDPVISGNGKVIAFASNSSAILASGNTSAEDVFVLPNPLFIAEGHGIGDHLKDAGIVLATSDGQQFLALRLPHPPETGAGEWQLLVSPDLNAQNWQAVPDSQQQRSELGQRNGIEWILIRHTLPLAPGESRFLRAQWIP